MIQPSSFSFPTPIQYGPGILTELGSVLDRLNISKPLVICDRFLPETDAFARFRQAIDKASGIDSFEVFKDVHPNPIEADVKGAVEVYQEGSCDGIIGLGGGSALDVAKVCRLNIQRPDFAWKTTKVYLPNPGTSYRLLWPSRPHRVPEAKSVAAV